MLIPRVPSPSSPGKGLYNPKAFVTHAASLDQACAHCPRFPTAASRRSLGRVSVPVWPIVLSDRLPIAGTVGRYPAVYLIGRGPIPGRGQTPLPREAYPVSAAVSRGCPGPRGRFPRVTHPCAAVPPKGTARLACVKRAASVRSEPGSNSQLQPGRPRVRGPGTGRNARMLRDRKADRRRPPTPAAAGRARRGEPRRPAGSRPLGTNTEPRRHAPPVRPFPDTRRCQRTVLIRTRHGVGPKPEYRDRLLSEWLPEPAARP